MANKKKQTHDSFEGVESVLTRTEQYIEDNQKSLTIILLVIFILFGGYYGYKKLYLAPRETEAREQMFVAENYFRSDSFRLALQGDGNNYGFEDIIDEYGLTKSSNLSQYYKGISELHLGNYEAAIESLKDFDVNDEIIGALSLGAIGDAYLQMDDPGKAENYYKRAVNYSTNEFSTPIYLMKLGRLYESQDNFNEALETYTKIKKDFINSAEGGNIEKYIAKVELKMQ